MTARAWLTSLRVRLLALTLVTLALALSSAGWWLTSLFRDEVMREFDATLVRQLDQVTARLQIGDDAWRDKLLTRPFFDAARFPEARFVSTRVEPVDATHARVHGDLTLRGVTREVVLDAMLNAAKRHPMPPFRRTVGFSATR